MRLPIIIIWVYNYYPNLYLFFQLFFAEWDGKKIQFKSSQTVNLKTKKKFIDFVDISSSNRAWNVDYNFVYHVRIQILGIVINILFYETSNRRVLYLINTTSKRIRTMLIRKWIISKVLIVVGYFTNLWTSQWSDWKFILHCCMIWNIDISMTRHYDLQSNLGNLFSPKLKKKWFYTYS